MSNRNPEYEFVETDAEALEAKLVAAYETMTGITVRPASPEKLFLQWIAAVLLQERVQTNYAGNQNIPSRAEGENLDALGELFYATQRPEAQSAVCTQRFYLSEPQTSAVVVPAGTRVTDTSKALVWETVEETTIPAGERYVDTRIRCQTPGVVGNGYAKGQIRTIIDLFDYYSACENVTVSDGGSDRLDDEGYYKLMRSSMDGYSTAGAMGGYIYHAMRVSSEIADVVPNSPSPGEVRIYVLMTDGTIASEEMKQAVLEGCSPDHVRAFTDHVLVGDPEQVPYDIDLTYWTSSEQTIGSSETHKKVSAAVGQYIAWQSGKLGRDINPSYLSGLLMTVGIKRVELRSPIFTRLRSGKLDMSKTYEYEDTIPQIAAVGNISLVNGGSEDE